jgi:hypothetical protein
LFVRACAVVRVRVVQEIVAPELHPLAVIVFDVDLLAHSVVVEARVRHSPCALVGFI